MPNLDLVRKDDVSTFRKIAIGTWRNAYDPSVYGTMELRMDRRSRTSPSSARRPARSDGHAAASRRRRRRARADARRQRHPALESRVSARHIGRGVFPGGDDRRRRGKIDLSGATLYTSRISRSPRSSTSFRNEVTRFEAPEGPGPRAPPRHKEVPSALLLQLGARLISFLSLHAQPRPARRRRTQGPVRQHHDHQHRLARPRT